MKSEIKSIKSATDNILAYGADTFLKNNSEFSHSNIEGVYHYKSNSPIFDRFIMFDFGKSEELSLVVQEKKLTLKDIKQYFNIIDSHYDFREDFSKVYLNKKTFIILAGKIDISSQPMKSIDARGNIKYENEIQISSIVIELS